MKAILKNLLLLALCWSVSVEGYPMIVEVDEEEERVSAGFCLFFNFVVVATLSIYIIFQCSKTDISHLYNCPFLTLFFKCSVLI